jgi:Pectate lyase superfamily protein
LPDFSYAGYGRGERPIPDYPRGVSVRNFGAKGDGQTDDTKAFQKALAEVASGAVEVPPGRYVITDFLEIKRSRTLLRGADPKNTVLFFPKPLNEIKPDWGATTTGQRTSNYSWSGGFVVIRGSFQSGTLTEIVQRAKRGSRRVQVARVPALRVGREVVWI